MVGSTPTRREPSNHDRAPGPRATGTLIVALLPLLFACEGSPEAPAFAVRDSAGVEVVESIRPSETSGPIVGPDPLLRIGAVDGDPNHLLSGVTGAVRLTDGGVAVADGGSQEVRFFDAQGSFVRSVGHAGAGPGEFTGLAALGRDPEGGLWAWDFSLRRITWMDESGEAADLSTLGPEPPVLDAVGPLADGSFVLRQLWGASATASASDGGLRRDPIAIVRFDRSGTLLDSMAVVPGREVHLTQENGRGVMTTPPFGRNAVMTLRDGYLVVGTQDRPSLVERSVDGSLRRRIVLPQADLGLTNADFERFLEDRVKDLSAADRPGVRSALSDIPRPDRRPAFGPVASDGVGRLWVGAWTVTSTPPPSWSVIAPEGHLLYDVEMPPGFFPLDIGEDWILGVQRDELGVEYVVLYPLRS